MYCRPENVLYWSNCQTYRTEDYDKYMKKREADEYSITMKEVVGDRIHFWNHCPNLPVFCNAFRHLEEVGLTREELFIENLKKRSLSVHRFSLFYRIPKSFPLCTKFLAWWGHWKS